MTKVNRGLIAILLFLLMAGQVFSQSAAIVTDSFKPVFNPRLETMKVSEGIKVDGNLDEAAWNSAGKAGNFVERHPGDNARPAVETETYITYDENNLYVAFKCYDDPSSIRATMCQRDQYFNDDAVCVLIDTYGDASWAYEFYVNPYGVQKDMLWTSVHGEDRGYDLVWNAAARITPDGYEVEMAIPFASLRFPSQDVQSWRVDFWRIRPRESYFQYSWAANDRDEPCWPCKWGTVDGIKDVQPGKGFEVLPSIVANQNGSISDYSDPESSFENGDPDGDISLGAKYSLSSDITVEATVNPDFSQIEADAAQIDVNTTIALLYPERRPFFQEGSDLFRTLFNSFSTRTINDPLFAAKLTGRMDKLSVGFVSSYDETTPYIVPYGERSVTLNAYNSMTNALRMLHTFGSNSQIGFIATDRRFDGGGSGTILAVDGNIRLSRAYSIDGQFLAAHTAEPDNHLNSSFLGDQKSEDNAAEIEAYLNWWDHVDTLHTAAFDGESYWGGAFISRFKRRSRNFNFTVDYNQVAPSYRTQTGYDPWVDYRNLSTYGGYTFYMDNGIFQRITPQFYADTRWDFGGTRQWQHFNGSLNAQLRWAQTNVNISYSASEERWSGYDTEGLWRGFDFEDLWHSDIGIGSRFSGQFGYYARVSFGRGVARWVLEDGDETSTHIECDIKPMDKLIIEPTIDYVRNVNDADVELFEQLIARTRVRYQFNRQLSVRLVVQYNDFSLSYNAGGPGVYGQTGGKSWDIDPLITYRINPFTVFYLGASSDHEFLEPGAAAMDAGIDSKWRQTNRQFFMKLQYLWQI